jgi:hypothetical protein
MDGLPNGMNVLGSHILYCRGLKNKPGRSQCLKSVIFGLESPVVDRFFQTVLSEFCVDRTALELRMPEVFGHAFQIARLSVESCARLVSQTVNRLVRHASA